MISWVGRYVAIVVDKGNVGVGREVRFKGGVMRFVGVMVAVMGLGLPAGAETYCTAVGSVTDCTTVGNLAPVQDRGCIALAAADPGMSPADLAMSVVACAKGERAGDAAELMVLMLARGLFDTERVADETAHQGLQVLQMQVGSMLTDAEAAAFQEKMRVLTEDRKGAAFADLCQRMAALGVPAHDPAYMIAHGMNAFTGEGGESLVQGFDAAKAWDRALHEFLSCPV